MNLDWNVVATARGGHEFALLTAIGDMGWFESASTRDVIVGRVEDGRRFLDELGARLCQDVRIPASLGHVMTVTRTVELTGEGPHPELEAAVRELARELRTSTYHVRVGVHGRRGTLHAHHLERHLGDVVWDELVRAGQQPHVIFDDPDVVLQIEVLADRAGIGFIDRSMRERYPFLRVR